MTTFSIIFPLLFLVSLGFLATRFGAFNKIQIGGISKFIFNLCIPVFLFLNMYKAPLETSLNTDALFVFYIPVLAIFAFGFILNKLTTHNNNLTTSAIYALGCSYSNTILVGLPIIISAIGVHVMGSVFFIITFHSALLFSLTFLLSQINNQANNFNWIGFFKNVLLNPVVSSITLGLIFNALRIEIPIQLNNALELLAKPALTGALFVLGANLSFYQISKNWHMSALASALKLFLLPTLVYGLGKYIVVLNEELLAVTVLLSASPLGVNAYLIAMQLKEYQATLASTVVLSTILSVISFSFWLSILI
ncbi:transporter [Pseudoalteromonas sp. NBT06-2]|uniref:AEC family transporter n=1 Tax=Pseudoalteromonas sp. NBT06-2 TaxID=2025950 RepID=UPI000BA65D1A|nr:AEC family transporter [Pseudoalteromonas sp. NBT06-2]PAJ72183.1 transporter [Pseudoalteromonas sp. NBT06-2]